MALTFKIGSLDLSSYVRVTPGEGLDPFGDYLDPQFADEALAEGQALLNLATRNREGVWPVHLKAASKDALHALIQQIRQQLDTPNTTIEWRDDGASASTVYDLVYGKFIPEFDYRRSQHNWASGHLALSLKPYGHTGTTRLVATAAATGLLVRADMSGASLAGDVRTQTVVAITTPTKPTGSRAGWISGYAVLPHPSYQPEILAASLIDAKTGAAPTALIGASGAVASQYAAFSMSATLAAQLCRLHLPPTANAPAVPYQGRNRLLAVPRGDPTATVSLSVSADDIPSSVLASAVSVPAGGDWRTIDLGVFSVPTTFNPRPSGPMQFTLFGRSAGSAAATLAITEFVCLPEERTILSRYVDGLGSRDVVTFDGTNQVTTTTRGNWIFGVGQDVVGGHQGLSTPTSGDLVGFALPAPAATTYAQPLNGEVDVAVQVRERFSFAR